MGGVASERTDLFLHPPQRALDVEDSVVTGGFLLVFVLLESHPSDRSCVVRKKEEGRSKTEEGYI
jgi:hypothetical protein